MKKALRAIFAVLAVVIASILALTVWYAFHIGYGKEIFARMLGRSNHAHQAVREGAAAYRREDYEDAIIQFKGALQIDPKLTIAGLDLANTYAHRYLHTGSASDLQLAAQEYRAILENDPQNPEALRGLGGLYVTANREQEGRQYQERARVAKYEMGRSEDVSADEDVPPLHFKFYWEAEEWRRANEPEQPAPDNAVQISGAELRVPYTTIEQNLIHRVAPEYPQMARIAHVQGDVVLEAEISKSGMITKLQATSGHPILIQAATDAVRQWRYRPVLVDGKPTDVQTTITIKFRL